MSEPQNKGGSVDAQGSANGLKIDPAPEVDKVKLGEDGWKERYYVHNFQLNSENECERIQRQVVRIIFFYFSSLILLWCIMFFDSLHNFSI
ncbi:unnamed protein product [Linum tenue]|uniref:Xrn1 helical domain-containing protein n=1 Tax=Linum tenue TaxID=586396 RepID=A0AAV0RTF7_9ROSI|nr:unnamed protein product [Linum tenue]